MKLNMRHGVLMVALASLGTAMAGSALAAPVTGDAVSTSSSAPAAPQRHWHGHGPMGGSFLLGTLLRAAHQLNLSDDQKSQIKTILTSARSEARTAAAAQPDIAVLGNPADPNYATALQTVKTNAANRIQRESELQSQIYNVLTSEQKSQLPMVLAGIKAKMAQRRAQHAAG
jgi:Spy/CpxP family protein refolding chaperone